MKSCFLRSALLLVPLIIAQLSGAATAPAFVAEDLARLKKERKCPGCDLRNADLKGADLREMLLEGANLAGADLSGANLEDAFLEDATLVGANLTGANLLNAGLDDATWVDGRTCKAGSLGVCK